MNVWDIVIIAIVIAVAVFGMVRFRRNRSCHGGGCGGCDGCSHFDACGKKGDCNSH